MDLPQLVQRVMFAGGRRLLSAWARSSCSLASARQAMKIRLCQQRRVEQRIVPGSLGAKRCQIPSCGCGSRR